ncbi:YwaF family protein [Acholeplasma sp. OttesenSCG-928-E16]|nr:YwaF family protein [Acholeplasma sp. OttesenSCG-928-E16]
MSFKFDLPEIYPIYSIGHITQIIMMIILFVVFYFVFRNKKKIETLVYAIATIICYICISGLLIYSFVTGIFNLEWVLPLHLCNLFFIILPIMTFSKGRFRDFFKDYGFYIGMGGCVLYVLLPANTQPFYEAWHIVPTLVFIHHLTIGLVSIYLISSGVYKARIRNFWKMFACLFPLLTGAFICNAYLGTNFCFMNPSMQTYPLGYIEVVLGKYYPYIFLALVIGIPTLLMLWLFSVKQDFYNKLMVVINRLSVVNYINQNKLWNEVLNKDFIKRVTNDIEFIVFKKKILDLVASIDQKRVSKGLAKKLSKIAFEEHSKGRKVLEFKINKLIFFLIRYVKVRDLDFLMELIIQFPEKIIYQNLATRQLLSF